MLNTTAMMLNPDGSCYHLHAYPEDIAPTVILVGDPKRATLVAQYFDEVEVERSHREFVLKTGQLNGSRLSVISTGIGTSNIDIVLNELDMLVNTDLKTQHTKKPLTKLKLIRLGTSGSLQQDTPVNSLVVSSFAFAFGDLLQHYPHQYNDDEKNLLSLLKSKLSALPYIDQLYLSQGDTTLVNALQPLGKTGITFTSSGFYAPQGRTLRTPANSPNLLTLGNEFDSPYGKITNIEMETAAIYGLGKILGHQCCSVSTIVANRMLDEKSPAIDRAIENMIEKALDVIISFC